MIAQLVPVESAKETLFSILSHIARANDVEITLLMGHNYHHEPDSHHSLCTMSIYMNKLLVCRNTATYNRKIGSVVEQDWAPVALRRAMMQQIITNFLSLVEIKPISLKDAELVTLAELPEEDEILLLAYPLGYHRETFYLQ